VVKAAKSLKSKLEKYESNLCGFLPRLALTLDPRISSNHSKTINRDEMRQFLIRKYSFNSNTHIALHQPTAKTNFIFAEARKLANCSVMETRDEIGDFYTYTEKGDEICEDPLKWWSTIGLQRFPNISKSAKDCLTIMASSVPSETEFSVSSGFVTPQRARMSDELLEEQMKLNSWFSLLDDEDVSKISET
jgi:hypothetical protein